MKKRSTFVSFVDKQFIDGAFQWSKKCAVCLIRLQKLKKRYLFGGLIVFKTGLDKAEKILSTNYRNC